MLKALFLTKEVNPFQIWISSTKMCEGHTPLQTSTAILCWKVCLPVRSRSRLTTAWTIAATPYRPESATQSYTSTKIGKVHDAFPLDNDVHPLLQTDHRPAMRFVQACHIFHSSAGPTAIIQCRESNRRTAEIDSRYAETQLRRICLAHIPQTVLNAETASC